MRKLVYFPVPAGTERSQCDACPKQCYWIRTAAGKRMLVDVDVEGGIAPTSDEPGRGWAHFATCPQAQRFRRAPAPVRKRALRMAGFDTVPKRIFGRDVVELKPVQLVRDRPTPVAPQPSLFESPADLVAAAKLLSQHSGVGESRILTFAEDARAAALSAAGRTFATDAHNSVREAANTLEKFYGERW